jgi:hypothetical protein
MRFAMCKVWRVTRAGFKVSAEFQKGPEFTSMTNSLVKAKIASNGAAVKELIRKVETGAALYRTVSREARVKLGDIANIAVPLDSRWRQDKEGAFVVQPLIAIKPSSTAADLQKLERGATRGVATALKAAGTKAQYFTHPYGLSTLR